MLVALKSRGFMIIQAKTLNKECYDDSCCTVIELTVLLLVAPIWLSGRCSRYNSPPTRSVMDFIFRRSDDCYVSVGTVHPSLLRCTYFSSPRWFNLQSLSSDVFLVSPLYVAKPHQSCFPAPLCYVLYFQSLPDIIVFFKW